MSLFQALVLGVVQGATEFLPVSSSGHLVLVPFIAGWPEPSVAFIVAVHLGTLISVVWVFRERLIQLLMALVGRGSAEDRRFVWMLAIASVPAAVIGAVFNDRVESAFERPVIISFLLAGTAWILFSAESAYEDRKEEPHEERAVTPVDAGVIGVAQAVAILPGISRSGSTIGAGMWRGLTRQAAARFSFLMAVPIIFGATLVKLPDMAREGASGSGGAIVIGVITAAVVGVISIRALLELVTRRGFRPFAIYCLFAATAGILTGLARG
jgi:undecaprenyl-diphosphatase